MARSGLKAIFVLTGGLDDEGDINNWTKCRLNLAMHHYHAGTKIISLGGRTYHKPMLLDINGRAIYEAAKCSEYLIAMGIPKKDIYKEIASMDTIGSAYFAFTNYILPMSWTKIMVITSEFHIVRTKIIFDWMKKLFQSNVEIYYDTATDEDIDAEILSARKTREQNGVENVTRLVSKITNVKDFCAWFYEEHDAYRSHLSDNDRKILLSKKELDSY